ncbi:hypothetical protein KSC_066340 [Ktedonobacter sp. SOSP1-52]|uniref:HypC/HybG/HupF family hydrogenase formation chaperone n=1 Tax=Ktedonobacter sp. SOSP1-52 TaxID=2778366 RepID=UPI001915363B|nr:HypC/HybG/HupF family hydrogenase formation chaperone [Ktedonobacter sp. SOSP1-52]GHO67742.1 hypothetical protein KSC_066340 [Ktedonobacter sp. SOSP1-52]
MKKHKAHNQEETLLQRMQDTYSNCTTGVDGHCITCSDQALPARILSVDEACGIALVEIADEQTEVDVTLLDHLEPGDMILVHGGTGISLYTERT